MKSTRLIVLDVDGTLTDGTICYDSEGKESKSFSVKDGMALAQVIKHGIEVAFITGRSSSMTRRRGEDLGVRFIYQNVAKKLEVMSDLCSRLDIDLKEVLYIGDDINDYAAMKAAGYSGCPSDASHEIKEISDFIATKKGGDGAVREVIEKVLRDQGVWETIVGNYVHISQ